MIVHESTETGLLKTKSGQNLRLIRIKQVVKITGISKSYIYQLVSKGQFPQSVNLIQGGSSVAWVESEVLDFIESRIQSRNNEVA